MDFKSNVTVQFKETQFIFGAFYQGFYVECPHLFVTQDDNENSNDKRFIKDDEILLEIILSVYQRPYRAKWYIGSGQEIEF